MFFILYYIKFTYITSSFIHIHFLHVCIIFLILSILFELIVTQYKKHNALLHVYSVSKSDWCDPSSSELIKYNCLFRICSATDILTLMWQVSLNLITHIGVIRFKDESSIFILWWFIFLIHVHVDSTGYFRMGCFSSDFVFQIIGWLRKIINAIR